WKMTRIKLSHTAQETQILRSATACLHCLRHFVLKYERGQCSFATTQHREGVMNEVASLQIRIVLSDLHVVHVHSPLRNGTTSFATSLHQACAHKQISDECPH